MNKKTWMNAAFLLICSVGIIGCQSNAKQESQSEVVESSIPEEQSYIDAIDEYLVTEIGSQYLPGDVCIPCITEVAADESNADDVKVWGDYWVYNYKVAGDTLKTVSGGSHPGLFHLKKIAQGYEVTGFDQVADGSEYQPSAKRIFGDYYDKFHAVNSDDQKRKADRKRFIGDYVQQHGLSVKCYQDYGWPAISL